MAHSIRTILLYSLFLTLSASCKISSKDDETAESDKSTGPVSSSVGNSSSGGSGSNGNPLDDSDTSGQSGGDSGSDANLVAPANLADAVRDSSLTATPTIDWDSVTGAAGYEMAIGTTSGGTDILDWTSVGTNLSHSATGLTLQNGEMYYASVRAVDSEGNKGPISTGDGWLVGGLLLQDITDQTVNENSAITAVDAADLSGGDTDVDSNPITYSCYVDNTNNDSVADRNSCTTITGMGFNTATGELTWTPGAGQGGSYEVKIDATSASSQDEKVFTIVVNGSFVTEWQTDNTGSSNSDQITLPLIYNGSYNFVVDWGDGSSDDTITAYDDAAATHTFQGGAGLYTVTITGEIEGWSFGNGGTDAAKLTRITHWGNFKFGDSDFQFHGAQNLVITATGWPELTSTSSLMVAFGDCDSLTAIPGLASWDVSDISNMSYLFWDSSTFDQDISNWDVSAATDMQSMFQNATNFDQDIGSWDVSKVTNMTDIFDGVTLSTVNYDALLVGWSTQDAGEPNPPVQPSVTFSGGNSVTSGTGAAAKTVLEAAPNLWTISDGD